MINLIPEDYRVRLLYEYKVRKRVISLVIGLFFIIVILLEVAGFYGIIYFKKQAVTKLLNSEQKGMAARDFDRLANQVKEINSKSGIFLGNNSGQKMPSQMISEIINRRQPGIKITSISINSPDVQNTDISIKGKSDDRRALIEFVSELRKQAQFKQVDSPISNIIHQDDSSFEVTIKVAP